MIVVAYLAIGFLCLVAIFIITGPKEMWFMLNDRDPNEPYFGFTKTTTEERRRRDDDHCGAWSAVWVSLFLWPLLLLLGAVFLAVEGLVYAARKLSEIIKSERGAE